MSEEEAEAKTAELYALAARVKNLARYEGASLTPVGEILCNYHIHVLTALYRFADTLEGPKQSELLELLRMNEDMPAKVIKASKRK